MTIPDPAVTALGKRPCPNCGGEMEWNAAKQALACPYCGHVPEQQPIGAAAVAAGGIVEHDLDRALLDAGAEPHGYNTATVQVKCQSCHAVSVFEPTRAAQRCEFCGSPSIVPYAETSDAITPESLLPVRLSESQVRDLLRTWYASRWFAPDRLKSAALTDALHGIYVPYWTFDARAYARWTAESGNYYYETEYSTDSQGQRVSRQVRKVRWYPSEGQLEHFFDDELVSGTVGVRADLLRGIEPFPTGELTGYDPAFVRGWTVERYQVDLRQAAGAAQQSMDHQVYQMCAAQVPGDTHRNLDVSTTYADRTFKHILVPVWLVTYMFGPRTFQVLVNGYTGAVAGDHPRSWVKIFFYIVLPSVLVLLAALYVYMSSQQ